MTLATLTLAACVMVGAFADSSANIAVEGRGMPQVECILRDGSKVQWGGVNFIVFGPGWQFAAQDFAAKEHKKTVVDDPQFGKGLLCTGKIGAGATQLQFREEFFDVSKGGPAKARVRWTISSQDGKPMALERAYVRFPLALNDFAGGTVSVRSRETAAAWIVEVEDDGVGFDVPEFEKKIASGEGRASSSMRTTLRAGMC